MSSIVLLGSGKLAIRYFSKIADIPRHILLPIVVMFCVFGVMPVQSQMFDVGVMLAFGALGYIMMKINMAAAPFLMGFILGPLFEDNLRRSFILIAEDITIFRSPICWISIVITILSLFMGVRESARPARARHAARGGGQ
ncbi:MAG: tripartite tricarboxylate transporter permease [Trueperaceae bacterium]|nr:tripartite tricarboxylate transporter permease [Trueperaceae bacterium]